MTPEQVLTILHTKAQRVKIVKKRLFQFGAHDQRERHQKARDFACGSVTDKRLDYCWPSVEKRLTQHYIIATREAGACRFDELKRRKLCRE